MNDEDKTKIDYIKTIFDHNQGLIQLADTKANIILGINSILIPIIFGVTGISLLNLIEKEYILQAIILNTTSLVSLIFLAASFIFSILVIKARLSKELENNIFFLNILKSKFEDYKTKILEMKNPEIREDYLKEIYSLARINEIKYEKYKWALLMLIIGIIILISGYFLIAISNYFY